MNFIYALFLYCILIIFSFCVLSSFIIFLIFCIIIYYSIELKDDSTQNNEEHDYGK